jgi:hypothetical protein
MVAPVKRSGRRCDMQTSEHRSARQCCTLVSRLRRQAHRPRDVDHPERDRVQARPLGSARAPASSQAARAVAAVGLALALSACSGSAIPRSLEHANPASAAGVDSGQGGDALPGSSTGSGKLAALAKRVHDSGEPLELAGADAGTPRARVVDGGGPLPPVDAADAGVDAGELLDAGHDAARPVDAGELLDAARCPFRCGGTCSIWPCP